DAAVVGDVVGRGSRCRRPGAPLERHGAPRYVVGSSRMRCIALLMRHESIGIISVTMSTVTPRTGPTGRRIWTRRAGRERGRPTRCPAQHSADVFATTVSGPAARAPGQSTDELTQHIYRQHTCQYVR